MMRAEEKPLLMGVVLDPISLSTINCHKLTFGILWNDLVRLQYCKSDFSFRIASLQSSLNHPHVQEDGGTQIHFCNTHKRSHKVKYIVNIKEEQQGLSQKIVCKSRTQTLSI